MYPNHRIVWNPEERLMTVTAASSGRDGILNNSAGVLFEQLTSIAGNEEVAGEDKKRFLEQCMTFGWITSEGKVNGAFTRTPKGPHLKRIQIELSIHCNLRCGYCYSGSGPTHKINLAYEVVKNILDEAVQLGTTWIDFTGGEFFLYPAWTDVVHYSRTLGLVVTIHTNGMLLSKPNVEYLVRSNVRQIQVSLDSHIPEIHDGVRGLRGAFERTIEGIQNAKDAGLGVRVCIMVHKRNKSHIASTIQYILHNFSLPVALDRIIPAGGELDAQLGLSTREYYEVIAPLIRRNVLSAKVCQNQDSSSVLDAEPHCGVAHSFIYVTAQGEFALCPTMTSRERHFLRGPSIHEMSLSEAWHTSAYFNRYRHLNCRNVATCPASHQCGGGCRSNAYLETNELDSPDYLECNLHKNSRPSYVDFKTRYAAGDLGVV